MVRELAEETGVEGVCGELVGWVERFDDDDHFVILDFRVAVLEAHAPRWPATTPPRPVGSPSADVAELNLVDGLAEFLHEHGVLATIA